MFRTKTIPQTTAKLLDVIPKSQNLNWHFIRNSRILRLSSHLPLRHKSENLFLIHTTFGQSKRLIY